MLKIENLQARIEEKEILKGLSLTVGEGEVHAIMGPNGSGKSTLASVLAGREDYEVTGGTVTFNGKDLLDMPAEERAREGLFLAFQYPVEIPGVSNMNFLKAAVGEVRKHRGLEALTAKEFLQLVKEKSELVELDGQLANRAVNEGFSGGEKKRNEIFACRNHSCRSMSTSCSPPKIECRSLRTRCFVDEYMHTLPGSATNRIVRRSLLVVLLIMFICFVALESR
jgi:Fe-S cluster assembly ATP-binding protein